MAGFPPATVSYSSPILQMRKVSIFSLTVKPVGGFWFFYLNVFPFIKPSAGIKLFFSERKLLKEIFSETVFMLVQLMSFLRLLDGFGPNSGVIPPIKK